MVKLYDSFSYLLIMIKRGEFEGDTPESLYHFGCTQTLEGIMKTVRNCEFPLERLGTVLEMLVAAEAQGRVSWRSPGSALMSRSQEIQRFQNTLQKAREMGADIPEWDYHSTHYDAYWNIPAMRKFLGDSVIYANRV
jgi:hypothetical protein